MDNGSSYKKDVLIVRNSLPLEIHITDRCNLNCIGCDHFSPLAKDWYYSIPQYEKDIKRLFDLFGNNVDPFKILGGEPFLHPDIESIIQITRKYFKNNKISIITNGTLLNKITESFWELLKELKIDIVITRYSINLNLDDIIQKALKLGIDIYLIGAKLIKVSQQCLSLDNYPIKEYMHKVCLNLNGDSPALDMFTHCGCSNRCITLRDGKIYSCPISATSILFENYFNTPHLYGEESGIDIYSNITHTEILKKLATPLTACKYCNGKLKGWDLQIDWQVSKRDISEWS